MSETKIVLIYLAVTMLSLLYSLHGKNRRAVEVCGWVGVILLATLMIIGPWLDSPSGCAR